MNRFNWLASSGISGVSKSGRKALDSWDFSLPGARLYDDYTQMLAASDVDVINVVLPNHAHAQAAIDAVNAGKHVVLEKPMGLSLAE